MASYPNEASITIGSDTYVMTNRKPDRGLSYQSSFGVAEYQSQIPGYSARRLLSRRPVRTFTLSYTNILKPYLDAIILFYEARGGTFESFDFDLAHINQTGSIRVVFSNAPRVSQVFSKESTTEDIYTVTFDLRETFT